MSCGEEEEVEEYIPYVSLDPLNDPKSFTFKQKVYCVWTFDFYCCITVTY